jgi:hypothetical protein
VQAVVTEDRVKAPAVTGGDYPVVGRPLEPVSACTAGVTPARAAGTSRVTATGTACATRAA